MKAIFTGLAFCLVSLSSCAQETAEERIKVYAQDGYEVESYNFDQFQNKFFGKQNDTTYVLNFWATWCRPCVAELPYFLELEKKYEQEKIKFIFVSLDFPKQIEKQLLPWLIKKEMKSQVILLDEADANSWIPKVCGSWQGSIPATYIYKNKDDSFFEQSFSYASLKREIDIYLND